MASAPPPPPPPSMDLAGAGHCRHKFEAVTGRSSAAAIDPARTPSFNRPSPVAQRTSAAARAAAPSSSTAGGGILQEGTYMARRRAMLAAEVAAASSAASNQPRGPPPGFHPMPRYSPAPPSPLGPRSGTFPVTVYPPTVPSSSTSPAAPTPHSAPPAFESPPSASAPSTQGSPHSRKRKDKEPMRSPMVRIEIPTSFPNPFLRIFSFHGRLDPQSMHCSVLVDDALVDHVVDVDVLLISACSNSLMLAMDSTFDPCMP